MRVYITFSILFILIGIIYLTRSNRSVSQSIQESFPDPDAEYFAQRSSFVGWNNESLTKDVENRLRTDFDNANSKTEVFSGLNWTNIGPSNTGGRITSLAISPENDNIIYAGAASGGVFKSTDFGTNWTPIFDNQQTQSIGDVVLDPNDDEVVYVGTGEPNTGGGSITYDGIGLYRSSDGGNSWNSLGLKNVGTIGKVAISKANSNIIYVAAVGNIYQKSANKGLFKSTNKGASWSKVLYLSDSTSVNDVVVSPTNPNLVYATTWERISRPGARIYGGITSNLHRSTDGGVNWSKLLPDDANRGKITIDMPPTNSDIVYISIANKNGTFNTMYKYNNNGLQTIRNGLVAPTTYTWWFGGVMCHPLDSNIVYFADFNLFRTNNGGGTWSQVASGLHVDQHRVAISSLSPNKVVVGNDGGVYVSTNTLSKISLCKISNAQVYDFDVYKADEKYISAGFQDNSFARTTTQISDTWQAFGGGDGVQIRVHPNTRAETYSSQYGALNISSAGIGFTDRKGWKCPIRLDPVKPSIRYFGTNKLYKFDTSANRWNAISGDLTMGSGTGIYGTITAFGIAPSNQQYIYTGSDDGRAYITKNGGASWSDISAGLPGFWCTFVKVDRTNPEVAYIGFSGYRYGFKDAHLYKTKNGGATWVRISNDLPQIPVNDLETDPLMPNILYLATDIGVYYSINGGRNWKRLGKNMPSVVTLGLNFAVDSRILYAGTYGRGIYKIKIPAKKPTIQTKPSTTTVEIPISLNE
jgi:photosystem II stability/assembly factor-like uncharacterized protein